MKNKNDKPQVIHTDGFLFRSNPSPIGGGYTIVDDDGNLIDRKEILKVGLTNNEAEVTALIRAVELVEVGGEVVSDSTVALRWIRRGRTKSRPDLNAEIRRSWKLVRHKKVILTFRRRKKNLAGLYNERHPCRSLGETKSS